MATATLTRSRRAHAAALLDKIQQTLDLTTTDLGRLFGVRRQAVEQWRRKGVPAARQEKAATAAAVTDLLSRMLKPERIPGAARRPAKAYSGLTMLEMIERDRHGELLEAIRRSFDWSATG